MQNTVHDWELVEDLGNATRERCGSHCAATCTRSKASGMITTYDAHHPSSQPQPTTTAEVVPE